MKTKIGVIGCGNISSNYFINSAKFKNIEVIACADLLLDRAKAKAEEFSLPKALTLDQMLSDPDVEIIINLTVPTAHAEVAIASLESGKHYYGEKPLAVTRDDARKILQTASENGLRVGSAPDTFLGASQQMCRKIIDDGEIGEPIAASAFMLGRGVENGHPDPEFFFKPGGGPLFDMGPYYLTSLINLIGGIKSVAGSARATFAERTIGSEAKKGEKIVVETPTHIAGLLNFDNGAIGTIVTSFDVWSHSHSNIEIYGTEGSMIVPDPNSFAGTITVRRHDESEWREAAYTDSFAAYGRGVGVADLAASIAENRPQRAGGELAYHVLDVMVGILEASDSQKHVEIESHVSRPKALPTGLSEVEVD